MTACFSMLPALDQVLDGQINVCQTQIQITGPDLPISPHPVHSSPPPHRVGGLCPETPSVELRASMPSILLHLVEHFQARQKPAPSLLCGQGLWFMIAIPCVYRASLLLRVFSLCMLPSFRGYRPKEKLTMTLGHLEASSGMLEVLLPRNGRARIFLCSWDEWLGHFLRI